MENEINNRTSIEEMEQYYTVTNISLKDLSEETGYSYKYIRQISSERNWKQKRNEFKEQVNQQITDKMSSIISVTEAEINQMHYRIWQRLIESVKNILNNPKNFMYSDGTIKIGMLEKIANVMEKVQNGQRLAMDISTIQDKLRYTLELKKLEAMQHKLQLDTIKVTGMDNTADNQQARQSFVNALGNSAEEVWNEE